MMQLIASVRRKPETIDTSEFQPSLALACAKDRPAPIMGVINGAKSIEPITTAGESCSSPSEAIAAASPNIVKKSTLRREPRRNP